MNDFIFHDRVDFADTDAGGVVFFANVLRWVTRAEGAWFRALGFDSFVRNADGSYQGFPRVSVKCDYRAPFTPGETFAIALAPVKVGRSSFTYSFRVFKGDENGLLGAEGTMTIVFAGGSPHGDFKLAPLPEPILRLKVPARKEGE
jgi:YbgC/YbaW family acyl-CoA thioester hydrolase